LILEAIVDIEKAFNFPFEDREWTAKLGLGAAIGLVPILNFAWYGYMVGILRNIMEDVPQPLPTWDDLGKKFTDGLISSEPACLLLPILILLPPIGVGFLRCHFGSSDIDLAQAIAGAGGLLFLCVFGVFGLYGIVLSILHPAILVIFAREGTFASCFKLRQAFDMISRNAGPFFTAWGLSLAVNLGVGLVAAFVTTVVSFIPCLGTIIGMAFSLAAGVYIIAVYAHLFGQFGRVAFGQNALAPVG
jgi:hypothetical protein